MIGRRSYMSHVLTGPLFRLRYCRAGPIPASFGRLVLLEELVLSGNGFTGQTNHIYIYSSISCLIRH